MTKKKKLVSCLFAGTGRQITAGTCGGNKSPQEANDCILKKKIN